MNSSLWVAATITLNSKNNLNFKFKNFNIK